jgi:hypothetical protein
MAKKRNWILLEGHEILVRKFLLTNKHIITKIATNK